jgi:hypothetical protein
VFLGLGSRGKGISDGAVTHMLKLAPAEMMRPVLVQTVRDSVRRGETALDGLAQDWTSVDGKYSCYDHHVGGLGQKFEDVDARKAWWRLGTLRAMLVSSENRQMLGLRVMAPVAKSAAAADGDRLKHTGETTNLLPFVDELRQAYGDLCRNFVVDAGLWSRELFHEFDRRGLGIFAGLKGNRGDLYNEAERVLGAKSRHSKPIAESPWEPYKGGLIRRDLWRTTELKDWLGWRNVRQVVLVRQTRANHDGKVIDVEDRYFASNVGVGALHARQALTLVRRHWAIENDGNWTFDVQFGEDDRAMCTQNVAPLVLAIIRMIAYNLMQVLRKSHVAVQQQRPKPGETPWERPRPWDNLTERLNGAMRAVRHQLIEKLRHLTPRHTPLLQ